MINDNLRRPSVEGEEKYRGWVGNSIGAVIFKQHRRKEVSTMARLTCTCPRHVFTFSTANLNTAYKENDYLRMTIILFDEKKREKNAVDSYKDVLH